MSDGTWGGVVWLTGLPAAGKTTLGRSIERRLRASGVSALLLDSDEVRQELCPEVGYSAAERDHFYELLARLAAMLSRRGFIVVVAATANLRRYRERARELCPRYWEVFVDADLQECRRRDPKGLYGAAALGEAPTLPGVGVEYEPPVAPAIVAHGGRDTRALEQVLATIYRAGSPQIEAQELD